MESFYHNTTAGRFTSAIKISEGDKRRVKLLKINFSQRLNFPFHFYGWGLSTTLLKSGIVGLIVLLQGKNSYKWENKPLAFYELSVCR